MFPNKKDKGIATSKVAAASVMTLIWNVQAAFLAFTHYRKCFCGKGLLSKLI
jgi:hypothetical protein